MRRYDITSIPYPFWVLDHLIIPKLRSSIISRHGLLPSLEKVMDEMVLLRFREDKR